MCVKCCAEEGEDSACGGSADSALDPPHLTLRAGPDAYSEDDPDALNADGVPNILAQNDKPTMIFVSLDKDTTMEQSRSLGERWGVQLAAGAVEAMVYPIEKDRVIVAVQGELAVARAREYLQAQAEPALLTIDGDEYLPLRLGGSLRSKQPAAKAKSKAAGAALGAQQRQRQRLADLPASARTSYPGGPAAFAAALEQERLREADAGAMSMGLRELTGEQLRERKRERAAARREARAKLLAERRRRAAEKRASGKGALSGKAPAIPEAVGGIKDEL